MNKLISFCLKVFLVMPYGNHFVMNVVSEYCKLDIRLNKCVVVVHVDVVGIQQ